MTKYLLIYSLMDPATKLTIRGFSGIISQIKAELEWKQTKEVTKEDVDNCDILLSVRTQDYYESGIAEYAKKNGKLYCLMLDDDFLSIPNYTIRRFIQYKALMRCIKLADVLFSTNDLLGRKIEALSHKGKFVKTDTIVGSVELYTKTETENETIKIVYYINDGSMGAFDSIVYPLIIRLYEQNALNIEWHLMGINPQVEEKYKHQITSYEHMDLDTFKQVLRESGFTFGIAPLQDSEFSRGKYINKFIEYTCAGLPCIYSDVEPYSSFVVNNETGLLTENSVDGWIDSIHKMQDKTTRERITENARNVLKENMTAEGISQRIMNEYPELATYKAPEQHTNNNNWIRWQKNQMVGKLAAFVDPVFRAWGRLRCEGFRSLIQYSAKKIMKG